VLRTVIIVMRAISRDALSGVISVGNLKIPWGLKTSKGSTYQRNEQCAEHTDHSGGRHLMQELRGHDDLVNWRHATVEG